MKTYRVCITRVEHTVQWVEVTAESTDDANDIAWQMLENGEVDFDGGETVHADEFVNDIEED